MRIGTYAPGKAPDVDDEKTRAAVTWMEQQLLEISRVFSAPDLVHLNPLHSEPDAPRDGDTVYADGNDWNPGQGVGPYTYVNGVWRGIGSGLRGAFHVTRSTNQTGLTGGGNNKVQLTTKAFDTNSWYDNVTNFRYQPTEAGTYFFYGSILAATGADSPESRIFKNGAGSVADGWYVNGPIGTIAVVGVSGMVTLNGSSDYAELFAYLPVGVTSIVGGGAGVYFGGFKVSA